MKYQIKKYIPTLLLRLLLIGLFILIVFLAYFFQESEVNLQWGVEINPYYDFISRFPIRIYFVICFTVLSILFVFVFIALSLYYSFTKNRNTVLKLKYDKTFAALLSSYFLNEYYKTPELRKDFLKKN